VEDRVVSTMAEIREWHDLKGHSRSSEPGWCAESNGVTATYCEHGLLLAEIARLEGLVMVYRPVYEALVVHAEAIRRATAGTAAS
jgi:hypothetical protein